MLVVDIDSGKDRPVETLAAEVELSLGRPLDSLATPSGGIHLIYRCDRPVPDGKWEGGTIKCASGHVMAWNFYAILRAAESLQDAKPVRYHRMAHQQATGSPQQAEAATQTGFAAQREVPQFDDRVSWVSRLPEGQLP